MNLRTKFGSVVWMMALAGILGVGSARANTTPGTLVLSGTFSTEIDGGSIDPGSTWTPNGGSTQSLLFVYCIDIDNDVAVPGTYNNTPASTDGTVIMTLADSVPPGTTSGGTVAPPNTVLQNINNQPVAGAVAYLLDTFAVGAANLANSPQAVGLQEAIWQVIYGGPGSTFNGFYPVASFQPGPDTVATDAVEAADLASVGYNASYLAGTSSLKTASTTNFLWFSPNSGNGTVNQALVGYVPEPTTTVLLGAFLAAALLGLAARRKLA